MKYYGKKDILLKLKKIFKEEDVIIVCIGTDKHVWDSLGPMVGSMLQDYNIKVYGNLNNPITAMNVEEIKEKIEIIHPDSVIIAIDIAVTDNIEFNKKVYIREGGIKPGIGVGITDLSVIGDYSILYYVYKKDMNNERIRNPYNGALEVVKILEYILDYE